MRGRHLAIDQGAAVFPQPVDQVGEGDLRGVGDAMEHRLAAEQPSHLHAVESAHERAFPPYLDAVGEAAAVQLAI